MGGQKSLDELHIYDVTWRWNLSCAVSSGFPVSFLKDQRVTNRQNAKKSHNTLREIENSMESKYRM